jgi:hypothetical protein
VKIFNDNSISWKAKGIYFYISSTNQDFNKISLDRLKDISLDGITSIKSGIKELVSNGYIEIIVGKENGRFTSPYYKILK